MHAHHDFKTRNLKLIFLKIKIVKMLDYDFVPNFKNIASLEVINFLIAALRKLPCIV